MRSKRQRRLDESAKATATTTTAKAITTVPHSLLVESDVEIQSPKLLQQLNSPAVNKKAPNIIDLLEQSPHHVLASAYNYLQTKLRFDILSSLPHELRTLILQNLPTETIAILPTVSSQ